LLASSFAHFASRIVRRQQTLGNENPPPIKPFHCHSHLTIVSMICHIHLTTQTIKTTVQSDSSLKAKTLDLQALNRTVLYMKILKCHF
jgi:hypothetical protein